MKGIILAGGAGTRLYPLTQIVSKQALPVYDKPMIYYPLSILMQAGIREILIISTPDDTPRFKSLLGDGNQFGVKLTYKVQVRPDGLAQAFILGEDHIGGDSVAMILGDNIFVGAQMPEMLKDIASSDLPGATVIAHREDDPRRFGVVELDAAGKAISIEEKPVFPKSHYCVTGLYFYDNQVSALAKSLTPSPRDELEITDLNRLYMEKGLLNVKVLDEDTLWMDAGTYDSLTDAAVMIRREENRSRRKIACLEEIAFNKGWISRDALREAGAKYANTLYGAHLLSLLRETH